MRSIYVVSFILLSTILVQCTSSIQQADVQAKAQESIVSGNYLSNYPILQERSYLLWYCSYKYGSTEHYGSIEVEEGNVQMDGEIIVAASMQLNMQKLKVKDIVDSKENSNFLSILRGPSFFDIDSFDKAEITIDSISIDPINKDYSNKENSASAKATITFKGMTREQNIKLNYAIENKQLYLNANFKINRTNWNMNYASESFETNLVKDKIIDDWMNVKLHISAKKYN